MRKIALAIEHFDPLRGGAEAYAVALARTLVENGWEVHLFGKTWKREPDRAVFHPIHLPAWLPSWVQLLLFAHRHRRMIRCMAFDIVLGFGNTLTMNVYQSHGGVHRCSAWRKTYSQHNPWLRALKRGLMILSPKYWTRQWIEAAPFRMNPRPHLVAISDMIKNDLVACHGVRLADVDVIYNGVDTGRFSPGRDACRRRLRRDLYLGDDQVVFLFVAHELKKKGIEPLVDSVAALGPDLHPTVRVVVVGGWPYSRLTRRIQQLGVERQFIFTGPQAVPEMFYAASDVFVLPTYYDACSLVVAEAMNCGLPVITTTANGAAGMLRPGRDGYLILHPPDPSALKTAMQRLLCPQRRREMSRMAAAAGRRYSVNANHRQMLDLFSTLADGRLPVGPGREQP